MRKKYWLTVLIASILILGFISYFFSGKMTSNGTYRIALDPSWNHLQLYREDNVTNFSIELVSRIAEKESFSVQFVQVRSDHLFIGLQNGEYEGVLSSSPIDFDHNFTLSNPYFPLGPVLVISSNSHVKSLQDLEDEKVGFLMGTESIIPHNKNLIHYIPYDYYQLPQLISDINNKVLQGAILRAAIAYQYTKGGVYQSQLKIASLPLNDDGLCLISKNKSLINRFNNGLKTIQNDDEYKNLLLKWDLPIPDNL